ncbi:MAG: hypothetical protein KDB14_23810 [Planctomycetales bacterium]|nr:hypothetical protein [Planctomycetales bacterium]
MTLDRRTFAAGATAAIGGMLLPSQRMAAVEPRIDSKQLVTLGINGLARAAEMSYFADGHRGAALISAHLMCADNQLDDAAAARIIELFDLNWAKSKLCRDFPEADPVDDAVERVGKALAKGRGTLRQVGHDAIFAMHAMKAFQMVPATATEERVQGVCRLIDAFKPWRDDPADPQVDPPPFADQVACSRFILQEASASIDRFIGFGQGFAGHMLTFGQSLVEMAAAGQVEWAESCRVAFCKYVTVTRKGPEPTDRKISEHQFSKLRPDEVEYWQQRGAKTLGIGHAFKYPYAYYDLLRRAKSPEIEKEFEAKAWRLF